MPPVKHSILSPSKSEIWIHCSLSLVFLKSMGKQEPGEAAIRGSNIHLVGETLIRESLGLPLVDNKTATDIAKTLDNFTIDDFEEASKYADFVVNEFNLETSRTGEKPEIFLEHYVTMDFEKDAGGTLDGCLYSAKDGFLSLWDLKTGRNPIYAYYEDTKEINSQLALYALYMAKELILQGKKVDRVRLTIFQNSIHSISTYETNFRALEAFEDFVLIPAMEEMKKDVLIANPNPHCTYCPGLATCKAKAQELTQIEKKPAETMSNDEIAELLPKVEELIKYGETLKVYALKKALNGETFKGYKLVSGRPTRVINDPEAAAKVLLEKNIQPYQDKKLLGLTELTKLLGKKKFNELLGPFIEVENGSPVLVSIYDKREEIVIEKENKN